MQGEFGYSSDLSVKIAFFFFFTMMKIIISACYATHSDFPLDMIYHIHISKLIYSTVLSTKLLNIHFSLEFQLVRPTIS